jgi:GNAT superfamily N-acetyltransferase
MFALYDGELDNSKKLTYVYVTEDFRGLGIGVQLMDFAKQKCKDMGSEQIVFDTLNPNLDRFYEKRGAKVVCEASTTDFNVVCHGKKLGFPMSVLRLDVNEKDDKKEDGQKKVYRHHFK